MVTKEDILLAINDFLSESQFVIDVKISSRKDIIILVDDFNGISIDDCKKISKLISEKFDTKLDEYSLEISSPGLTNPFKVLKQYQKNINKEVEIVMKDGEKLQGTLLSANENKIIVETTYIQRINNKKQEIKTQNELLLTNIKTTKNVISFQ
ncbi:MAG: ribosome assembly cofactor RimP [Bacteroidales bacterium]|jgi:ribosome maturation factor RimP|nr:ribosome assembly cofactor RimP [Bacteroidales bacterium]